MKQAGKRAALAMVLAMLAVLLSGCMAQLAERAPVDLSGTEISVEVSAPEEDGADDREDWATLYFLSEDGTHLTPVTRQMLLRGGMSRAQAALEALLLGPAEGERGVTWPDLGASRSARLLEVSSGVATVDLPAHTRTLPQETLYAVRQAIANTLTEFAEISYVNVLVGGREEGLDLGATLPVGTFTRVDDPDTGARYSRLLEQRLSGEGVTVLTTLYFPSADGALILPEVRSVDYAQVSPIEYLYTLLEELGKGAGVPLCVQGVPAPLEYIEKMPEIVRTQDGYLAIDLRFADVLEQALADAGVTLGAYLAMLTDTLMGFVPGVEAVKVTIGEQIVDAVEAGHMPDGQAIMLEGGLATRRAFAGFVGAPAALYAQADGGLARVQRVMMHADAANPRKRLEALMRLRGDESALPEGITAEDVLAVHEGGAVIAVNLSGAFAEALGALEPQQECAAVYAMVNTLTENAQAQRVAFFFDGKQAASLAGGLEMRGTFVRNPGMVVN